MKKNSKKPIKTNCKDPECLMGNTENGGNCRKNEIVYKIICRECEDVYIGETARNGHSRGLEHSKNSTSNNTEEKEKSVLLRHMQEKHEGNTVQFDMKTIASYQHNPLGRQCAEAIHIKNIEPGKRINNKTEYHQPGDVEIRYEKNDKNDNTKNTSYSNVSQNQHQRKNTEETNTLNETTQPETKCQKAITDFFKMMETHINEIDASNISSQDMINDARARRNNKNKNFNCDQCDFETSSKTLLKRHQKSDHEQNLSEHIDKVTVERIIRKRFKCNVCDFASTSNSTMEAHVKTIHKHKCDQCGANTDSKKCLNCQDKNIHVRHQQAKSKRINCNMCNKRFNKQDTYNAHMKKLHQQNTN